MVIGRCISTPACLVKAPSGCPLASHLAHLYFTQARCSNRYGANIPRRNEIASRIAACRIAILNLPCTQGDYQEVAASIVSLTRANLRDMGVCSSEAADLCKFFRTVRLIFPGVQEVACFDSGQQVNLLTSQTRCLCLSFMMFCGSEPYVSLGPLKCCAWRSLDQQEER